MSGDDSCRPLPDHEPGVATPHSKRTMTDDSAPALAKRMARDWFFPTPVYHTDLARADDLNARLVADIRAWRERDPGGTFRSNVPQLGGWHSATDMHLRAEYTELTREVFELIHGVFADQGYDDAYEPVCDSMWANVNPRGAFNRHHTHPHALWSGVYYVPHPGRLRPALPHRSASPGARDHPVLRFQAPLGPLLGRSLLPAGGRAGSSPSPGGWSTPRIRTWRAPVRSRSRIGTGRHGAGRQGTTVRRRERRAPTPTSGSASASTFARDAGTSTRPSLRPARWYGRICSRG